MSESEKLNKILEQQILLLAKPPKTDGGAITWRIFASAAFAVLLVAGGWWARTVSDDVKALQRSSTILENDVKTIKDYFIPHATSARGNGP